MRIRSTTIYVVIGVFFVFYCLGYVVVRRDHYVVHCISYGADREYTMHDVSGGDAKLFGGIINSGIATFYTPLRYGELAWWHWAHPVGSPLTATHKQRLGLQTQ